MWSIVILHLAWCWYTCNNWQSIIFHLFSCISLWLTLLNLWISEKNNNLLATPHVCSSLGGGILRYIDTLKHQLHHCIKYFLHVECISDGRALPFFSLRFNRAAIVIMIFLSYWSVSKFVNKLVIQLFYIHRNTIATCIHHVSRNLLKQYSLMPKSRTLTNGRSKKLRMLRSMLKHYQHYTVYM